MQLSSEQVEKIGKLHGLVEGMVGDVKEIKDDMKETKIKAEKALKEVGKIKTVSKTIAAIGAGFWALFTFFVGGK